MRAKPWASVVHRGSHIRPGKLFRRSLVVPKSTPGLFAPGKSRTYFAQLRKIFQVRPSTGNGQNVGDSGETRDELLGKINKIVMEASDSGDVCPYPNEHHSARRTPLLKARILQRIWAWPPWFTACELSSEPSAFETGPFPLFFPKRLIPELVVFSSWFLSSPLERCSSRIAVPAFSKRSRPARRQYESQTAHCNWPFNPAELSLKRV